jgi:hypothetical protein
VNLLWVIWFMRFLQCWLVTSAKSVRENWSVHLGLGAQGARSRFVRGVRTAGERNHATARQSSAAAVQKCALRAPTHRGWAPRQEGDEASGGAGLLPSGSADGEARLVARRTRRREPRT